MSPSQRRSIQHPKSTRQQFSACGACRMRRVRCDLKDLPQHSATSCSNCKERGLKCVDEFADVKTVKLLRRGRRLQQVEAIYGKVNQSDIATQFPSPSVPSPPPNIIPQLHPDFFSSPFWNRFKFQRPIIDPLEFPARFLAHLKDSRPLSPEASIIAMLLVVWAASFGLDERGQEILHNSSKDSTTTDLPDRNRRQTRDRTHAMLREVLRLIDIHAIMRRPTSDGVRVLLLISPLMEELLPPLDILTTYETTISQVHALSSHSPSLSMHSSTSSTLNPYPADALVKARIFWYAFVHEGITTALRGGRLVLDEEDLETFQNSPSGNPTSSLSSPTSATFPTSNSSGDPLLSIPFTHLQQRQQGFPPQQTFLLTALLFSVPIRLSSVCRKVHAALTGRDARRRADRGLSVDSDLVREIWDGLDSCWDELDNMRRTGIGLSAVETERYVGGWQIFIFECHNIVREALKQHIISHSPPGGASPTSLSYHPTPPTSSSLSPHRLHALAMRRCMRLLPRLLALIKMHINTQSGESTELFKWDAGLVGDGCFFAGFLAAGGEHEFASSTVDHDGFVADCGFIVEPGEGLGMGMEPEEGVNVCLRALSEMRWAFAKGEEREQTIRMVWEMRGRHGLMKEFQTHDPLADMQGGGGYRAQSLHQNQHQLQHHHHQHAHQDFNNTLHHALARSNGGIDRPMLPPLTLTLSPLQTHTLLDTSGSGPGSTPHTAGTDSSASGWPVYSPPGTGTSGCSGASGGIGTGPGSGGEGGGGGSPGSGYGAAQQHHVFQKSEEIEVDGYYHHHHHHQRGEMDPFSFSAPETMVCGGVYQQRQSHTLLPQHLHLIHPNQTYLDVFSPVASSVPPRIHSASDDDVGNDDCHGFYECSEVSVGHKLF